jgi:MoaA/NifB/PqqE/SkfB family radical SAM enzyme
MKSAATTTFDTLSSGRVSKVIQIHPSLQCNLTCRHCYSNSAPAFKGGLNVNGLKKVIEELAGVGYNAIALSGGEPFLYRPLEELLIHSHSLGFFNSITTNAMLLGSDRAKQILKQADLIAISIDGQQEQHDNIRNFNGAFKKMEEGLEIVKDNVANYGFIHTVFPDNWKIINWLVHFALSHQAKLLHLHPLEMSGRAAATLNSVTFEPESLHKIYIAFHFLKSIYKEQLFMQLDLLHRDHIIENPNFIFHQAISPCFTVDNFSSIFKELIIDETGDIIPISHGCSKHFTIGNIYSKISCKNMIEHFMEEKMQDIISLYQTTYDSIIADEHKELVNWSEEVIRYSHEMFDAPYRELYSKSRSKELV